MRRRFVLRAGAVVAIGSVAGCVGGDNDDGDAGSDGATATEQEGESTPEPPDEPEAGEASFSVEPATSEIQWGETHSVDVTVKAGEDPPSIATIIIYEGESDSQWVGSFDNTKQYWQLGAGESATKTFEIEPPESGEFTVGLMNAGDEEVVETWDLTVQPPRAAFGEPISFYDGLDVTLDVELHDWMDFELSWDDGEQTGMYSVRPVDGQWVKVNVVAENTNMNSKIRMFGDDDLSGLAGSSQLDRPKRFGTSPVGADTDYEIKDETRHEEGARLALRTDDIMQENYWYPPSELISEAKEAGWVLFEADADVTVEDIEIRLKRNEIQARWE